MQTKTIIDVINKIFSMATLEKCIIAIIIIAVFWVVAILISKIIIKLTSKEAPKQYVFKLIANICKVAIIIIGFVTALGTIGINVSAIIASLGLTGFALGFALKDLLSNVLAGFMVLIYQPYSINDEITVDGLQGKVMEINLRYTVLKTATENILIPNSTMINKSVIIQC